MLVVTIKFELVFVLWVRQNYDVRVWHMVTSCKFDVLDPNIQRW